ncbi:MAG: D-alanyl-D-alanine endopeptidase [Castellaniella sp.]|uniref:serine hydrolase n=1 Tax=Castellaniella sp. TaxID=1955812 RepID=UPI001212EF01|nr:serine hydrolase [Castellaniella sp.]TAN28682.1 MAG: D-alanyl-D-alanine endopeptidase [Castellaniella sp.]
MAGWRARAALYVAAVLVAVAGGWSSPARAQVANFHPCNADPSLPICLHGYGRRIAVQRWGALPEPLDPDAGTKASLVTHNPAEEIRKLKSTAILVQDLDTSEVLFARDEDAVRPIASITKLMTALVVVKAGLPMGEKIAVDASDVGVPSELPSRLSVGMWLTRSDLLHMALTASENSAAHALGRTYPGGMAAFVEAMNAQAQALSMTNSRFVESVGLSSEDVSSARDLARLVRTASQQPLIRQFTTDASYSAAGRTFHNTNMLVGRPRWDILMSKTGTTREAGNCLVMVVKVGGRNLAMVLLDAHGMNGSRFGDAVRLRRILGSQLAMK